MEESSLLKVSSWLCCILTGGDRVVASKIKSEEEQLNTRRTRAKTASEARAVSRSTCRGDQATREL
jgi:hypothetical protein